MPTEIEAQGVTIEEAIQVALNQLGVTRDRVEIEIIHHPRSGFLGLGARRAKVRATVREVFLADGEEYDMSTGTAVGRGGRRSRRSRRRRGRRGETRSESEQAPRGSEPRDGERVDIEPAPRRTEPRAGRSRDESRGRGEGRGRDERGTQHDKDRGRRSKERRGREGGRSEEPRSQAPHDRPPRLPAVEPRAQRGEPVRRTEPGSSSDVRAPRDVALAAAPVASDASAYDADAGVAAAARPVEGETTRARAVPVDELRRRSETVLRELLKRMGFQAVVSSIFDEAEGEVIVTVESDAEGLLIGRRGQTLDALEHLVNRMALAGETAGDARIAIDVGGYRQRRRDTLLDLADRLKERALTQRRRIQLSPMGPRDRRILQAALNRDESIRTRVLGTGFYRRVLISPLGLVEDTVPLEADDDESADALPPVEEDKSA